MRNFTSFACVDWSGQAVARPKGIALACTLDDVSAPTLLSPNNGWSRPAIADWLIAHADAKTDLLVGIDFSPSLPFIDRGTYFPGWAESPADAKSLWRFIDDMSGVCPDLSATSFVDHPIASRHFRRHGGREGDLFGGGTGPLRVVEKACRDSGFGAAQSCFNLVGAAQVGKSSLTGMRLLNRLSGRVPVWPFDPIPATGPVIVEIYTTVAARAAGRKSASKMRDAASLDVALAQLNVPPHRPLARYDDHSTDAILTSAWLRSIAGTRAYWSPRPMTPEVARTEGWTFGIL